jgi:hypothetical protein
MWVRRTARQGSVAITNEKACREAEAALAAAKGMELRLGAPSGTDTAKATVERTRLTAARLGTVRLEFERATGKGALLAPYCGPAEPVRRRNENGKDVGSALFLYLRDAAHSRRIVSDLNVDLSSAANSWAANASAAGGARCRA